MGAELHLEKITGDHVEEVLEFLQKNAFAQAAAQTTEKPNPKRLRQFIGYACDNGINICYRDQDDKLAAVIIGYDIAKKTELSLISSALCWLKCCRCLPKFQRPIEALNFVESLIGDTDKLKELHNIETTEECYEIATVVIRTDLRQKGIGTEFVKTALERAKERGRKHATAFATVEPLRKTYANLGFENVTSVNYEEAFGAAHYNGKLESGDCHFMVCKL